VRPAIPVSEQQFLQISKAASWLCPADRDQFVAAVASELSGREVGEGVVARAISKAFRAFYRPIEIEEPPQQLRKLTYGANKLEEKYAALEANRQRRQRQRVDAR
jgi:hypothetical protein